MGKQEEKQAFKEKLANELNEKDMSYDIYDDTSKFKVEDSVIGLIQNLNEKD